MLVLLQAAASEVAQLDPVAAAFQANEEQPQYTRRAIPKPSKLPHSQDAQHAAPGFGAQTGTQPRAPRGSHRGQSQAPGVQRQGAGALRGGQSQVGNSIAQEEQVGLGGTGSGEQHEELTWMGGRYPVLVPTR